MEPILEHDVLPEVIVRRFRPTFLLRCVVLAVSVAIFLLVLNFSTSGTFTKTTIFALIVFWFLAIEAGLLPLIMEHLLVKKAEQSKRSGSIWFVDIKRKRKVDAQSDVNSDNPTIR